MLHITRLCIDFLYWIPVNGHFQVRTPPPSPLKNHQNIGFLSNTGPDPLKITKLSSQHSMFGHYRHANETPFKWRFAGGPMMARLTVVFESSLPYQQKTKTKKNVKVKLDPL